MRKIQHFHRSTRQLRFTQGQLDNSASTCRLKGQLSLSPNYTLIASVTSSISHLHPQKPNTHCLLSSRDNYHARTSWQRPHLWVTPALIMKSKKWSRENRKAFYSLELPLNKSSRWVHNSMMTNSLSSSRISICNSNSKGSSKKWRTEISRRM